MGTRLSYAIPAARYLANDTFIRATRGIASTIPARAEGPLWLIVAGTGRSGTSAVARVLHESGVSMGTSFSEPSDFNALGFYEDLHALEINQRMMGMFGLELTRRAPRRSVMLALGERHAEGMRQVISSGIVGLKDPLFSFTLEPWMRVLRRRPKVIVCLRGPEAYLHSATSIYGLVDRGLVEDSWECYLGRLVEVIEDYELETISIEYDQLAAEPTATVARLSDFVGRELDASYVDPSLRTHVYRIPKRHRALYARVAALGGNGKSPALAPAPGDAAAFERYRTGATEIEGQIAERRAAWESAVDVGSIASLSDGALEATRTACAEYDAALVELRQELMSLTPPDDLERHHELLRDCIDLERLPEVLIAHACEGPKPDRVLLEGAQRTWRDHCAPTSWAKAAQARKRELSNALGAVQT